MYLKSIEVHGFKSFANKIEFKFHDGITAIVGPNGSGKSNVADAVRWVLGEQRIKQLRGSSMQDVIFSGTETRKPMGYAYVAITLDNSDHALAIDFQEVTIARRIYRSGESEYLINGTLCRLKDVNELFYDTGIGKEGYSIIGQGQIDKILSGKPEERRELFDEAAGIVKFKRRKYASQKKLEDEQANLLRVNDILGELEKQVGPLERQSEKAKIYLKKKEELKTLDVNVFLLENEKITEQLDSITEKFGIASNDLEETKQRYEGIKTEYDSIEAEIEELDQTIEKARTSLSDTNVIRAKLENEIAVLKEQINSAKGSESHFHTREEAVSGEINEKEKERQGIFDEKNTIDNEVLQLTSQRDEVAATLVALQNAIQEINDRIEADKNTIIQALNQRGTIKSKLASMDTMLENVNIRRADLNSRLLRVKSDEEKRNETIKALEAEFEAVCEELRVLHENQAQMELRLGDIKDELGNADNMMREKQNRYHQEKSRLETLQDITEKYEGYGGAVKSVMEQKDKNKGIVGVVADIIKVDAKYETAIETALGGNIQNIVTDDEETAKKMIAFLKQSKGGRATFLPLTSIKNHEEFKTPEVLNEKGAIGMADTLVHIDNKYSDVAKAMLGRIVVVDTVDNATKIAKKFNYTIRMVTLEGELLVPGGAISGGAFKNNNNLLGRRRELEDLKKKVQALKDEIDKAEKHIEDIKEERNKLRTESDKNRALIQEKFIEQNTKRLNVVNEKEKQEETALSVDELKAEEAEILKQTEEIKKNKEEINEELKASEELERKSDADINELTKELETKRLEETNQSALVSDWDMKVEKMLQTQGFMQTNVDRINGEIDKLNAELKEITDTIAQSAQDVEGKEANIAELEKTIIASHTSQSEAEQKLKADIEKKEELSAKHKNFFKQREELSERMNSLDKEVYRLNSQKERLEESVSHQINYMWEEYEITLVDAKNLRDEEMTNLPAMKKQVSSIKDEIKKLGDVNVNAIEDYKNLMERYTFLKTQHDDLIEAEKTLQGIIAELDAAMRKQFNEKFNEINREFDKVFKELFGGGKGTLELIEEEDVLEAGIRVIAQPPGKKLQNMMQLSGGEKSLAAIALLFAIQNLKPSPFCLLDEIEAALDESNVGRFAKYLHKLEKNTQFIVITHRRGTMESADRLYGITMQEKGISALVSVNLIDKDLED